MFKTHLDKKPKIHSSVYISNNVTVVFDVEIAEDSSIWFGTVIRGDVNVIKIGKRTSIQDNSTLHNTHYEKEDRSDGNQLIIGDDVTIAHHCMLHGCVIKNAVLVGMGATILDGVTIKEESIVGANSLVTKNKTFPPRSLIMGNPAKFIRELTQQEVDGIYKNAKNYVFLKNEYLKNNI